MNQSVLPGFEFLLMGTKEIIQEYPKAQTVGELDKMLLKVCHEAANCKCKLDTCTVELS